MDKKFCVFFNGGGGGRELIDYEYYPKNSHWTKKELTLDQRCGSGSGQIRKVSSWSDPE